MSFIRHWSIRTKLVFLTLVAVGVALTLACVGVLLNESRTTRALKIEALHAQTRMLAFNSTGVLSFKAASAATQLLAALRSQPTVRFAVLYDESGRALASYPAGLDPMPAAPPDAADACRFNAAGEIEITQGVLDRNERLGTLYLCAGTDDLHAQLAQNTRIVVAVLCAALAGSILLVAPLQRSISRPIQHLAKAASLITSLGDYSIRVERQSEDELGTLCTQFNRMLERVEASDKALKAAHDQLEVRVAQRTAELHEEIARREMTQAELLRAKEAAEAANVAKSQFLANMSHEIRTPLNAILGFADLLRRTARRCSDAERDDYLQTIHSSGKHLLGLINDILDLSKIEAGQMDVERIRCSPQAILAEVVSSLRVRAVEKGLSLECRWVSGIPESVLTDPLRLRQLLINLVGNGIKFTNRGGIRILASLVPRDGGSQLTIQVIDTGIGIPAGKIEEIFNPFVQADTSVTRKFGGTGLGLAISRRIAAAMGGQLTVESRSGHGSTFTVTLDSGPMDGVQIFDSEAAECLCGAGSPYDSGTIELHGIRILVADDGDTNRKLIRLVLQRAGAKVVTVENGQQALDLATDDAFDLVLMDMQMPVMDGYTATTVLRQRGVALPIFALTANAMRGDDAKCRTAGCTGYLAKPVDLDLLVRTVADAVRKTPVPTNQQERREPASNNPATLTSSLPMNDAEFRDIVVEFVGRLHEKLEAMQTAFAASDWKTIQSLAHWAKGAAGTAGFPAFTVPAKELESAAKLNDRQEVEIGIRRLVGLADRIRIPDATSLLCQQTPESHETSANTSKRAPS